MNPAWSVILFTSAAGMAQGMVVVTAVLALMHLLPGSAIGFFLHVALALLVLALGASFFHLGRPERAWRAVLMWRTSWLSREVIVLPVFMAVLVLWIVMGPSTGAAWMWLCIALAALLWWCTAMIYACLRFVQEWAHGLTLVSFTLIGLSSGLLAVAALMAVHHELEWAQNLGPWALRALLLAGLARGLAMRRNARLKPKSTLQSATGIKAKVLKQTSMGMSAGAFNTREFFHGCSATVLRHVKYAGLMLGFVLPFVLVLWALRIDSPTGGAAAWVVALSVHIGGVMADRWFFFAQARHPQNLYYATVS